MRPVPDNGTAEAVDQHDAGVHRLCRAKQPIRERRAVQGRIGCAEGPQRDIGVGQRVVAILRMRRDNRCAGAKARAYETDQVTLPGVVLPDPNNGHVPPVFRSPALRLPGNITLRNLRTGLIITLPDAAYCFNNGTGRAARGLRLRRHAAMDGGRAWPFL